MSKMLSAPRRVWEKLQLLERQAGRMQEALGRIENRQTQSLLPAEIREAEYRVFSQWGEDGILQHLVRHVPIAKRVFVEFGVETYVEANTRFLLIKDNWSGLVMDGSSANVEAIKRDEVYWRYNLKAEAVFITRENINDLLRANGVSGEIGLLSVDIDGNDYWVWEAITCISPAIVVAEYNSRFGPERAVTTPYDPTFTRTAAHYSNIYYGASLAALCLLADRKGYSFVGCNSAGNNAFFVQKALRPEQLPELSAREGYVAAEFRESVDHDGNLTFLSPEEEAAILRDLPLTEIA